MINKYWIRKLFILWELPQLVLGLFFLLFISFKKPGSRKLRYKDADIYFVEGFPGGISLSGIIILNKIEAFIPDSDSIKSRHSVIHEYGHSIQSLWLGWLYLPLVGLPSLIRSIFWRKSKRESRYYYERFPEHWADALGKRYI
jgi:hypothetical protein